MFCVLLGSVNFVRLVILCLVSFLFVVVCVIVSLSVPVQSIAWKSSSPNDLLYVEFDFKLNPSHSLTEGIK